MIDKLTPEQEALIPVIRDEWIAHGLSTQPADRPEAEAGAAQAYEQAGLVPPRFFVWLDSPLAGAVAAWLLKNVPWDQVIGGWFADDATRDADEVAFDPGVAVEKELRQIAGPKARGPVAAGTAEDELHTLADDLGKDIVLTARQLLADRNLFLDATLRSVITQLHQQVFAYLRTQVTGMMDLDALLVNAEPVVEDLSAEACYGQFHQLYLQFLADEPDITLGDPRNAWDQVEERVRVVVTEALRDPEATVTTPPVQRTPLSRPEHAMALEVMRRVSEQRIQTTLDIPELTRRMKVDLDRKNWDQVREQVWNAVWGQHDAGWLSFYDFFRRACGIEACERLIGLSRVAKSAGWWWAMKDVVVLTERPTQLYRNPQGQLHNETDAALLYPDGFGVWSWNGTRVPQDLIEGKWSTEDILREPNAEIRRCAIEKFGWDRFIAEAKLKRVGREVKDPGNPGYTLGLYDVPEQIYETAVRVLLCTNATPERDGTRRRFGLTVPAHIKTPIEAAAWGFGLTADQYARTERAC